MGRQAGRTRRTNRRIGTDAIQIDVKTVLDRVLHRDELGALVDDRGRCFNAQQSLEVIVRRNLDAGEVVPPKSMGTRSDSRWFNDVSTRSRGCICPIS